ncbi:MAG: hypothetical protein Q9190_005671 [Brigantiaea leucoxantha]
MPKINIDDFFKPFAQTQPRQSKRPPSEHGNPESGRVRRPFSNGSRSNISTSAEKASIHDAEPKISISTSSSPLSSLRSLPSQPPATQTPSHERGQRISRNGEIVIKDSDDEQSNSDTSLEDINDLLVPPKSLATMLTAPELQLPRSPHSTSRFKVGDTASKRKGRRSPIAVHNSAMNSKVTPKYKFSLETLMQQRLRDETSQATSDRARQMLASLDEKEGKKQGVAQGEIDSDLLASVVNGQDEEGGDVDRLMMAVQRTEALHQESVWYFFKDKDEATNTTARDFPTVSDPPWRDVLGETTSRQQAFIGGFARDMATIGKLPHEVLSWLVDSACFERRDDLRSAYCETLRIVADQITPPVTLSFLNQILMKIGAEADALDIHRAIEPSAATLKLKRSFNPSRLSSTLDMINATLASLDANLKGHIICLLCRLLLDSSLVYNCRVQIQIENLLCSLIDNQDGTSFDQTIPSILKTIESSIKDSIFRLRLLQGLPTSSPKTSLFRRRLALSFFFNDDRYLSKPTTDLLNLISIAHHLNQPQFVINPKTNFPNLAATIAILAIGIDNGNPPPSTADKEAETAFNSEVDALSKRIKAIYTQIVDAGASHMKRTEAKEVLEAFRSRLEFAVRTRPKRKNTVWGSGGDDGGGGGQKEISEFFAKDRRTEESLNGQ